jgi:hypothetical protein
MVGVCFVGRSALRRSQRSDIEVEAEDNESFIFKFFNPLNRTTVVEWSSPYKDPESEAPNTTRECENHPVFGWLCTSQVEAHAPLGTCSSFGRLMSEKSLLSLQRSHGQVNRNPIVLYLTSKD